MRRIVMSGPHIVKAERAQHVDKCGFFHPIVQILWAAAKHQVTLGAVIAALMKTYR